MNDHNQLRDRLEDVLLAAGTPPTTALLDRLETAAEERAFQIAGEHLGQLIAQLDVRQRLIWQRLMGIGPTLDAAAEQIGVSAPAVAQAEKRLRRRLTKNRLGAAHR